MSVFYVFFFSFFFFGERFILIFRFRVSRSKFLRYSHYYDAKNLIELKMRKIEFHMRSVFKSFRYLVYLSARTDISMGRLSS